MRNALLASLGLLLFSWLGFELFPGHTYLQGATQRYVPILERLETPGFLSRDLVATHPNVTYTVYDEVALFLRAKGGLSFRTALVSQQILFRLAWLFGIYLMARASALDEFRSLLVAVVVSLGATLPGAAATLIDPEPVPRAFATGLTFLGMGWLACEKPLLAGLAAGLALLYDARVAVPFWLIVLIAFVVDKKVRPLLRPTLPILLVFVLLLANLAQLQAGSPDRPGFFSKISPQAAYVQTFRTPEVWVSIWAPHGIWSYLAILILGFWATTRIWARLNRQMRWLFVSLPLLGILSVPLSYLLLERLKWVFIPTVQPAKTLIFTVAMSMLACGVAAILAGRQRRLWEAAAWFGGVFAIQINGRILILLAPFYGPTALQLMLTLLLAGSTAWLSTKLAKREGRLLILFVPFAAMLTIPLVVRFDGRGNPEHRSKQAAIAELAAWAEKETWGASLFAFPDAWNNLDPGVFRAEARRAVWVDWESGAQIDYYPDIAEEWFKRWRQTMGLPFRVYVVQQSLTLPIDYYVLKRGHILKNDIDGQMQSIPAVFRNDEFVVYDANDLRSIRGELWATPMLPGG